MDVLNFIAGLAEIILTVELMILVFVIAAICAGIWFGLRFAEGKTNWAFDKVNGYIAQARGYEQKGLRLAVKPLIMLYAIGKGVSVTVADLVERARADR